MIYLQLFLTFLKIGALGFGGGYAMLSLVQFEVVERHQWITSAAFTDIVAISQTTPGPIAFNSATYIGYTATGSVWGSVLASVAVCIPAFIVMLTLCRFFFIFRDNPYMRQVLKCIKPVAIGLIGAAAVLLMNRQNFTDYISFLIFSIVLVMQFFFKKMNPIVLILLAGITGFFLYDCSPNEKFTLRRIETVPFTQVHFDDQFWQPRMEINRTVSIPSAFHQCEINGRFDNFALAGGLMEGAHQGDYSFDDTDPYKIIEGASYSLAVKYDSQLDAYLDSVITLIAAAQEEDGYLTTCVSNNCTRLSGWWGSSRWEKINSHELYNSGHLYEAAVAHFQATGKRTLLDVAIRNADLVCRIFGLDEGQIHYPSGHPIIEMALVKLYQVTGNQQYLEKARYFVDEAGRLSDGRRPNPYSQDHKPIMNQTEIVGHAVRAGYLYSGVANVASLQKDAALFGAVQRIWENMAGKKLYITGGIGSRDQGEGFGPEYELNHFNNYCETCASIANVYWNYRMFLATGESKYIDVLERALYNGVISGVSLSGDLFFYDNPLASIGVHQREPWFGCACCPGNVTRFIASIPGYAYSVEQDNVYVNLFAEGDAQIQTSQGEITLKQRTKYPWEGNIVLTVETEQSKHFNLRVRIPGWAQNRPVPTDLYSYVDSEKPNIKFMVNGKEITPKQVAGYGVISREWKPGDQVSIHFDMPVRRVRAHESSTYSHGLLAMERGPIVYCLEAIDQGSDYLFNRVIPINIPISSVFESDLLGGVVVLEGDCEVVERASESGEMISLPARFKAVPYSTWNNRGKGQMSVWMAESPQYAWVKPEPTIASRATVKRGAGVNDQIEPKSSADANTPYHFWWLRAGSEEEIEYEFDREEKVSNVEVYWLAFGHYDVVYRPPLSWKLLYKSGNQWREVEATSEYGVEIDKYNVLTFKPVTTKGLKLIAHLHPKDQGSSIMIDGEPWLVRQTQERGYSAGVIEWRVNR